MNHYLRSRSERKIAVVGSRGYKNLDWVRACVVALPEGSMVLSGGAPGVDRAAEQTAARYHIPLYVFLAAWDLRGRGAGLARNSQIVEAADEVIAFWDGKSRGTLDTIRKARAKGIPVKVYDEAGILWDNAKVLP